MPANAPNTSSEKSNTPSEKVKHTKEVKRIRIPAKGRLRNSRNGGGK